MPRKDVSYHVQVRGSGRWARQQQKLLSSVFDACYQSSMSPAARAAPAGLAGVSSSRGATHRRARSQPSSFVPLQLEVGRGSMDGGRGALCARVLGGGFRYEELLIGRAVQEHGRYWPRSGVDHVLVWWGMQHGLTRRPSSMAGPRPRKVW
jgi:hypothetical protein